MQRSRFCLVSTIRSYLVFKDTRRLEGMMGGLFIATIGFAAIMIRMMPDPGPGLIRNAVVVSPFGWHLFIGGLLFGFGMMLAGGCIAGHLYRLGEGSISSAAAFIAIFAGMGALQFSWPWLWDNYISGQTAVWLPAILGWTGAIGLTLALIAVIYCALRYVRKKSSLESERGCATQPRQSIVPSRWRFATSITDWHPGVGWVALGIMNVLMYWILKKPWTVAGEVMRWSQDILTLARIPPPPMQAVPGT